MLSVALIYLTHSCTEDKLIIHKLIGCLPTKADMLSICPKTELSGRNAPVSEIYGKPGSTSPLLTAIM